MPNRKDSSVKKASILTGTYLDDSSVERGEIVIIKRMDSHVLLSNQSMSNRKDSSAKKASFLNWHVP